MRENELFDVDDRLVMLTFDNNYVNQTINLMLSIVKHQSKKVSFYCVCLDLEEENVLKLLDLEIGVQVRIYQFNYKVDTGHWPQATLLRVFSPWLLDSCVEKILYLDSDILCCGSLDELYELDTPYIAMGNEISGNVSSGNRKNKKSLPEEHPAWLYCNAGVAVLNLRNIREHYEFADMFHKCCDICSTYYCNDQDFLNLFFYGKITYFNGLCYNFQPYELKGTVFYQYAVNKCRLIHFSSEKPWKDTGDRAIMRLYLTHSEYAPMRELVKKAYKASVLKAPYRAVYKQVIAIKRSIKNGKRASVGR